MRYVRFRQIDEVTPERLAGIIQQALAMAVLPAQERDRLLALDTSLDSTAGMPGTRS